MPTLLSFLTIILQPHWYLELGWLPVKAQLEQLNDNKEWLNLLFSVLPIHSL